MFDECLITICGYGDQATHRDQTMKIRAIVLFAIMFGMVIILVGCGPELIDCPDKSGGSPTAKIGRTVDNLLYEFGVVLVQYDPLTQQETDFTDDVPLAAVNAFFVKRGYTPKVIGFFIGYEVVSFGSDIDPYPMLEDLRDIPGVAAADLHVFHKTSTLLYIRSLGDEVQPTDGGKDWHWPLVSRRATIEVGMQADGSLYEFGVVVIQYNKLIKTGTTPAKTVNNFFVKKGYTPKTVDSFSDFLVVDIGDCVDTAPMLGDIAAIPGVTSARLNLLHTTLEVIRSESDVPGVSSF